MRPELVEEICETRLLFLGDNLYGELIRKPALVKPPTIDLKEIQEARELYRDLNMREAYIIHRERTCFNTSNTQVVENLQDFVADSDVTRILPTTTTLFDAEFEPAAGIEDVQDTTYCQEADLKPEVSIGEINFPNDPNLPLKDEQTGQPLRLLPNHTMNCALNLRISAVMSMQQPSVKTELDSSSEGTIILGERTYTEELQQDTTVPVKSSQDETALQGLTRSPNTNSTSTKTETVTNTASHDKISTPDVEDAASTLAYSDSSPDPITVSTITGPGSSSIEPIQFINIEPSSQEYTDVTDATTIPTVSNTAQTTTENISGFLLDTEPGSQDETLGATDKVFNIGETSKEIAGITPVKRSQDETGEKRLGTSQASLESFNGVKNADNGESINVSPVLAENCSPSGILKLEEKIKAQLKSFGMPDEVFNTNSSLSYQVLTPSQDDIESISFLDIMSKDVNVSIATLSDDYEQRPVKSSTPVPSVHSDKNSREESDSHDATDVTSDNDQRSESDSKSDPTYYPGSSNKKQISLRPRKGPSAARQAAQKLINKNRSTKPTITTKSPTKPSNAETAITASTTPPPNTVNSPETTTTKTISAKDIKITHHGIRIVKKKTGRHCRCDMCGERFTDSTTFIKHYSERHPQIACGKCPKVFNNPLSAQKHRYKHKGKKIPCTDCNRTFPFESQLKDHRKTHFQQRPHMCSHPGCSCDFTHHYDMLKHLATHTASTIKCPECEYKTKDKRNFKQHRRVHSGEQPYECKKCGKKFSFSMQKNRHSC